ncbi:MAG: DNA methyltransferase [Planctomycetota bacterium]
MSQPTLFPLDPPVHEDDWTFNGASTRELTHCYHDYPARMIPQIAEKLLSLYGQRAKQLFDPYCGTGTSLVEGLLFGLDVAGTDLNPLARLIATAKTDAVSPTAVRKEINDFYKAALNRRWKEAEPVSMLAGIKNLSFWFKPDVIIALTALSERIRAIETDPVRRFFQVAFSETVRESSNTRNDEFKLYRYSAEKLEAFNPDVFQIMTRKIERNYAGLVDYYSKMKSLSRRPHAQIYDFNTVDSIPISLIAPESVDIVVTSPPYGDSHTTVAYGQYSQLSAAWLGLSESGSIDRKLMGGSKRKTIPDFSCDELNAAVQRIAEADEPRAREVAAFYRDLQSSINHVASIVRDRGYACYVVGNRIVKAVALPTDAVIRSFFKSCGFDHIETFTRSIPNKRMPKKNSPTNIVGKLASTMTKEYIVVMRKRG